MSHSKIKKTQGFFWRSSTKCNIVYFRHNCHIANPEDSPRNSSNKEMSAHFPFWLVKYCPGALFLAIRCFQELQPILTLELCFWKGVWITGSRLSVKWDERSSEQQHTPLVAICHCPHSSAAPVYSLILVSKESKCTVFFIFLSSFRISSA